MVKIKYNSKNVDRTGGNVVPPKPGSFRMKVKEAKYEEDDGNHPDRLVFVVQMDENDAKGQGKGYTFWDYVNLDIDWKVDQWLQAAGVDTEKKSEGEFDTRKFKNLIVLGRVKSDTYQGEYRPKLAGVFEYVEPEDEDEEYEEEEYEEEEAEEAEEEEAEEEEEYEEEEVEEEEYEEEEEEEEEEPEPPRRPAKKAAAKKAPAKKAAAPARKPKPKPEPEPEDDYEDWDVPALKKECKDRGLSVTGGQSALIARLRLNDADPFSEDE
jgi:chemotaxis protein histidine kinase CheA